MAVWIAAYKQRRLPTFADGLRTQEIIAAAERSEAERRWVDLAELE